MIQRQKIYEGNRKILYSGPEPGLLVQHFKDTSESGNAINGKGVLDSRISSFLMNNLAKIGIATHFIKLLNMREHIVQSVEAFPLIICIRNVASGSFVERFHVNEGQMLPRPIMELYYKGKNRPYSLVSEDHIRSFSWMTDDEFQEVVAFSFRANDFLLGLFLGVGMHLCDIRFEFGRQYENDDIKVLLIDAITPDSFRVKDSETGVYYSKNPKDNSLCSGHKEIAYRLGILNNTPKNNANNVIKPWLYFFKR